MSLYDRVFTIVNTKRTLSIPTANFLLMKNVFTDPKNLIIAADLLDCKKSKPYVVGLLYKNEDTGQHYVIIDHYEYAIWRMYANMKPMGVAVFTDIMWKMLVKNKQTHLFNQVVPSTYYNSIPSYNELMESWVYEVHFPIFAKPETPYSERSAQDHIDFKDAYDILRGIMFAIKAHDNPPD